MNVAVFKQNYKEKVVQVVHILLKLEANRIVGCELLKLWLYLRIILAVSLKWSPAL